MNKNVIMKIITYIKYLEEGNTLEISCGFIDNEGNYHQHPNILKD